MAKCTDCGSEISEDQAQDSGLCGSCESDFWAEIEAHRTFEDFGCEGGYPRAEFAIASCFPVGA